MFDRASADDEERQVSNGDTRRDGMDTERSSQPPTLIPQPETSQSNFNETKTTVPKAPQSAPLQSCFLCLRGKRQTHYAIRIPCHRPRLTTHSKRVQVGQKEKTKRGYYEADSKIYERLVAAAYQYHGTWKKWIPFYGIVDVRELKFSFDTMTDVPERFEVHVIPLDYDKILAKCDEDLAQEPDKFTRDEEGHCYNGAHQIFCPQKYDSGRCIEDVLTEARGIKSNLHKLYLMRNCALEPTKADLAIVPTLGGMALDKTPIMHKYEFVLPSKRVDGKGYNVKDLPGIQILMGWQTDRIFEEGPVSVAFLWFALATVWVAVVVGGLAGDWNLSVAVGQLIMASLAVLITWLR